ncbi:hypothetical protein KSP40_PGU012504 [Platanthera guangdongensis]|uniref:Uncharacterized protein n=1 Tax=Platanthera guangdongensis TaxID=2320717 RepID=A0ABR2LVM3_9ASPA
MRMQRQSQGSPSPKLQNTQEKPVNQPSPAAESAAAAAASSSEEHDFKTEKPTRFNLKVDRSIHFIPLVTFLCILILFLYSHDPKGNYKLKSPYLPLRFSSHFIFLFPDLVTDGGFSATLDSQGKFPDNFNLGISATEMNRILGREKAGSSASFGSRRALKKEGLFRHRKLGNSN